MKTLTYKIVNTKSIGFLFAAITPILAKAEDLNKSVAEEQAENAQVELYSEIGIAVVFVVAVTLFLIFKAKHDKKMREKHIQQMQKVQASKRKAA